MTVTLMHRNGVTLSRLLPIITRLAGLSSLNQSRHTHHTRNGFEDIPRTRPPPEGYPNITYCTLLRPSYRRHTSPSRSSMRPPVTVQPLHSAWTLSTRRTEEQVTSVHHCCPDTFEQRAYPGPLDTRFRSTDCRHLSTDTVSPCCGTGNPFP